MAGGTLVLDATLGVVRLSTTKMAIYGILTSSLYVPLSFSFTMCGEIGVDRRGKILREDSTPAQVDRIL